MFCSSKSHLFHSNHAVSFERLNSNFIRKYSAFAQFYTFEWCQLLRHDHSRKVKYDDKIVSHSADGDVSISAMLRSSFVWEKINTSFPQKGGSLFVIRPNEFNNPQMMGTVVCPRRHPWPWRVESVLPKPQTRHEDTPEVSAANHLWKNTQTLWNAMKCLVALF